MHSFSASPKPEQRVRSDWVWLQRMKSRISAAQGPVTSAAGAAGGGGAAAAGGGGTPTTTSNPGELAQLQGGAQAPHKLGWKESEKLKQLYKVSIKD